jgi:hypothetical protein
MLEKKLFDSIKILPVEFNGGVTIDFDAKLNPYVSPVVYLLYNKEKIYIGETINIKNRFCTHNGDCDKKELTTRYLIHSDYFNKSVIVHLEAFLISHFSAEGSFYLLNKNWGYNKHYYFEKEKYEKLFPLIWEKLRELHIVKKSIRQIENSRVFKFSPFKSLVIDQQKAVYEILMNLAGDKKRVIVNGTAGTGKTVLAIYLMHLFTMSLQKKEYYGINDDPFVLHVYRYLKKIRNKLSLEAKDIVLVVSMQRLRETLKHVFSQIPGLSGDMVISPSKLIEKEYKMVLVDEAHRLKQRKNLANYKIFDDTNQELGFSKEEGTELDWIMRQSQRQIFFYDSRQTIRPTDISPDKFDSIKIKDDCIAVSLLTQIRSKGGNTYSDFVDKLLEMKLNPGEKFKPANREFEFLLFSDIKRLVRCIKKKDEKEGLSRVVAGFSWEWITQHSKMKKEDFTIENVPLKWNSKNRDYINSLDSVDEIGCIHTVQGFDLNYVGVIFGEEISYNETTCTIDIDRGKYKDENGKKTTTNEELYRYIINIYRTLLLRGIRGVYVYCCDAKLHKYFSDHITSVKIKKE